MSWWHVRDTTPRARKVYRCRLCDRPIAAGELHVHRTGFGESGPESARFHLACEALTLDWDDDDWETCDPSTFRSECLREGGGR